MNTNDDDSRTYDDSYGRHALRLVSPISRLDVVALLMLNGSGVLPFDPAYVDGGYEGRHRLGDREGQRWMGCDACVDDLR